MKYEYTHFIPENVAPKGATRIVVKKKISESGEEEICDIPSARFKNLTPPTGEPLYSFGLVSDCHTYPSITSWDGSTKLENALSYFNSLKNKNCVMVIGCGDYTQTGFYRKNDSKENTITVKGTTVMPNRPDFTVPPLETYYDETQVYEHGEILKKSVIPVFEIFGNHESYNNKSISASETTIEGVVYKSLVRAKALTGIPATAYTISSSADTDNTVGTTERPNRQITEVGDDLFIMVGQSEGSKPMSYDTEKGDFGWLKNTLEANKNRRCFIFIHSFIDDDWSSTSERTAEDQDGYILSDSGNPCGARGNSIFGWWEDWSRTTLVEFLDTLKKYPNVIVFHGHSHMKFESQEFDDCANYTDKNGFKSVHVPSLGSPRTLLDTDGNWTTDKGPDKWTEPSSQCYRVDVYPDCIVLNGLSFSGTTATPVPLGTYKIEI